MDEYATHLPVLGALFAEKHFGTVIEFGAGKYSTPFFLSQPIEKLWTVETDPSWAEQVKTGDPRHHVADDVPHLDATLIFIDDGLCLLDRLKTIKRVSRARPAGLVVIHDFENDEYGWMADLDHQRVFTNLRPWTGVMWNQDSPYGGEWVHRISPNSRIA